MTCRARAGSARQVGTPRQAGHSCIDFIIVVPCTHLSHLAKPDQADRRFLRNILFVLVMSTIVTGGITTDTA